MFGPASLVAKLGRYLTFPAGCPKIQRFRVVDMYTRASTPVLEEKITESFSSPGGILGIVITTTAFGTGIDCDNIR